MFVVSVIKLFDYFNCYKTCLEYDISAKAWESKQKKLNDAYNKDLNIFSSHLFD